MRTKSWAVRRNTSEQTLGDPGSVSADPGVVSAPVDVVVVGPSNSDTLVQTSIDVDTFEALLASDNGRAIGMMDMLETVLDGILIPDIASHGVTDVDTLVDYTNVSRQGALPSAHVIGTRVRLSNGVTITELDPARPIRQDRFPVSIYVAGKGKRKVDDISMFKENDSYAIGGCPPQYMFSSGELQLRLELGVVAVLGPLLETLHQLILLLPAGLAFYMGMYPLLMN